MRMGLISLGSRTVDELHWADGPDASDAGHAGYLKLRPFAPPASMGSSAKPPTTGTAFPFTGLAVFLLLLETVLSVTVPPNPYRFVVTVAALFATGYCALALIAGKSVRLSGGEVLAFTVGLAIVITSLSAVLVSIIGIAITDNAITVLGLPIALAAWYLGRGHAAAGRSLSRGLRTFFDFSDYTTAEKVIAGGLMAAILVSLVAFILLSATLSPDVVSPGLAIVGPDGTPGSLPTSFGNGTTQTVDLSVLGGLTGSSFQLRIRLVAQNATGNESFHAIPPGDPLRLDPFAQSTTNLTVGAQGTWSATFSLVVVTPGRYNLRFDLIDATSAVVASNVLPVVVS